MQMFLNADIVNEFLAKYFYVGAQVLDNEFNFMVTFEL